MHGSSALGPELQTHRQALIGKQADTAGSASRMARQHPPSQSLKLVHTFRHWHGGSQSSATDLVQSSPEQHALTPGWHSLASTGTSRHCQMPLRCYCQRCHWPRSHGTIPLRLLRTDTPLPVLLLCRGGLQHLWYLPRATY
jgi:hypothetical protein